MTDRRIAQLALFVALLALMGIVVHALIRDAESGGTAHTRGWTRDAATGNTFGTFDAQPHVPLWQAQNPIAPVRT